MVEKLDIMIDMVEEGNRVPLIQSIPLVIYNFDRNGYCCISSGSDVLIVVSLLLVLLLYVRI